MMRSHCTHILFLIIFTCLFFAAATYDSNAQSAEDNSASEIIFILDASGSMWGQIEGQNKIAIAKTVLKGLVDGLPGNTDVGLIAYGHREKGDCGDIETIVEPGPLNKASINKQIDELSPKGKTPITDSVLMAFDLVKANENAATVILVSDGIETCGGDPCKAVQDAKESGVNFIMHVVGFDVGDVDVSELECAAQAGGGLYLSAQNASELTQALETAVEIPAELPSGKLSVKVTAEGKLQDAYLVLINTETGEELKGQRTYTKSTTNPRIISLPDGVYDLEIRPLGMKGVQNRTITAIEIVEGKMVEKEVEFGIGELSLKVVRNGKLMDSTVHVLNAGTDEKVSHGRTYTKSTSNPIIMKLDPGTYNVEVTALEIETRPKQKFEGVEIVSGETIEKVVDYSSGSLIVGALQGEMLLDAVVKIIDSATGEKIAQGRTYTSSKSNPKTFELAPGVYDVEVAPLKIVGNPSQNFKDIQVIASETVEHTAQFSSGTLKVGALEGEKYVYAVVSVTDSKTGEKVANGRTYKSSKSNPKSFELIPGVYDVEVKSLAIQGHPVVEFKSLEIGGSGAVEKNAQFSSGVLTIDAKNGDAFADSIVSINNSKTGEKIASGRTYVKQKSFTLIPGSYVISVKPIKIEGAPEKTVEVDIKSQEISEIEINFAK